MGAALKNLDRWIYLMHQAHEASYYIARAEALGHPQLFDKSYEAILEFLAHFRSALNSYAKCFVSTGPGRMKLVGATVYGNEPSRLAAHDNLMELRHKYVAHSDDNEFERVQVVQIEGDAELVVRLQYGLSFAFDRLYELRDLIEFINAHIVDAQNAHLQSISKEIGRPIRVLEES